MIDEKYLKLIPNNFFNLKVMKALKLPENGTIKRIF